MLLTSLVLKILKILKNCHDCDLLAATFSTVHRSTRTKNHAALPLVRLDLSQSAKNWCKISQHSITVTFLSQLSFLLVLSNNVFFKKQKVEKKNPTNNKLHTGLIEEVARFHSNAGG